jgi:hypothetical protein
VPERFQDFSADPPGLAAFNPQLGVCPSNAILLRKRTAGICVVLDPKTSSTYSLGSERVLARLGRAGVIAYASDFSEPAASHPPASLFPRNEG